MSYKSSMFRTSLRYLALYTRPLNLCPFSITRKLCELLNRAIMVYNIKSVLIVENVGQKCIQILNEHGINVTQKLSLTEKELINEIPEYDALIVQSDTKVTIDVFLVAKKLKIVAAGGAYAKNIDLFAALNRKIRVINAPRGSILSVCEYTCTMIMALAKQVVTASSSFRAGISDRAMFSGSELQGKTLGFVGLCEVAKGVAVRMKSFGMRIVCFDESLTVEEYKQLDIIKMTRNQMWPEADYIVLYTSPFQSKISVFITSHVLRACKRGVKIIVVGHVGVLQPRDFYEGLKTGQIGGAALDFYNEIIDADFLKYSIHKHPKVIFTVHIAAHTKEAIERGGQEVAEQIVNLCKPNTYDTPISSIIDLV